MNQVQKKPNIKGLIIFVGCFVVFVVMIVLVFKSKGNKGNDEQKLSADEAAIAAKGEKKVAESASAASSIKQSEFGAGMQFDSQGKLLGSNVAGIYDIPQNRVFSQIEAEIEAASNQPPPIDEFDVEGINSGIDQSWQTQHQQQPTTQYRSQTEADTAKTQREISKMDRELYRESALAFSSERERQGQSSQNNQAQQKQTNNDSESRSAADEPMKAALAILSASQQQGAESSGQNNSFGAVNRPLVSMPGQLSDMRIGGLPEVIIAEGKYIDGVAVNHIETSYHDNPVTVLVTRDFLDRSGRYILIPQGAKILGLAFRVQNQQQQRMFITFHRIIFPDGRSAYFPERQLPEAFNPRGTIGSNAKINNFWFRKFGAAIVLGLVEGLAYASAGGDVQQNPMGGTTMSSEMYAVQTTSRHFEQVTQRMMDYYSNFAPTVTVKAGTRIKVYLSEDMLLSTYARKQ
jgi:type IV secretory pathway VirB10-like protein